MEEVDFKKQKIAYFSMEIALDSKIPTYSGGLGVLAGDYLRSACDLEVPVIGITLLYKKGYFHQAINNEGYQEEHDEIWDPFDYLEKLKNTVKIKLFNREVTVACWLYRLKGLHQTNPIIFLDTDLDENSPEDREITKKLYGTGQEYRILQEAVLGMAGTRLLDSLKCNAEIYHMNEGHSSFLTLELFKKYKKIEEVRKKCVFTTHTPVAAGHDVFPRNLVENVLQENIPEEIKNDIFENNSLNMTHLGFKFSSDINSVSKKHQEVTEKMFPGYKIESVTNGVHSGFWTSKYLQKIFDKYIPNWKQDSFNLRSAVKIPEQKIWKAHEKAKQKLVKFINKKYDLDFNSNIFTICFARRMTPYKQGELLLSEFEKLKKISKKFKGLQIVYAGKAHPNDNAGKEIIQRIIKKSRENSSKLKICFIDNYDLEIAKMLVSGGDIWLNTPQKPMEASGTSGMKAAHNGVPHFSVLDGWWLEGHVEGVTGWSIGSISKSNTSDEVDELYSKLQYVILPLYYKSRDKWIEVMKNTITINASFFNTHRMVQQYVMNSYFNRNI